MITLLIIDNFDSFTFNLVHYAQIAGQSLNQGINVLVRRNHESLESLIFEDPDGLIISPGPGRPDDAGVSNEAILHFGSTIPTLGVCLGHQCMAQLWGARIVPSEHPCHGKTSEIQHDGLGIFEGIESPLEATRYHSLIVDPSSVRRPIIVSSTTGRGEIMGLRIDGTLCEGIQFHPESILTSSGQSMMNNFIRRVIEKCSL